MSIHFIFLAVQDSIHSSVLLTRRQEYVVTRTFYITSLVVTRTLIELYEKQSSHFVPEILALVLPNVVCFYFSSSEAGIANAIPSFR